MAYIQEQQESRTMSFNAENASTTRVYHLVDFADSQDALEALYNSVPSTIDVGSYICGLPEFEIRPVFSDPDRTVYEGSVTWKTADIASGGGSGGADNTANDPKEPEDPTSLVISYSGQSKVIQHSVQPTTGQAGSVFYSPTNPQGTTLTVDTINQQRPEFAPVGVEVNSPIINIRAKTVVASTVASQSWFSDRFRQVWTTNNATWNALPAGCVMLTGMESSQRADDHWDVTYNFEYRPREPESKFMYWKDGASSPSTLTIPSHAGWVHVDVNYNTITEKKSYEDNDEAVLNLTGVTLHNVYYASNFNELGMNGV